MTAAVTFQPVTTTTAGTTATVTLTQGGKLYYNAGGTTYKEITNGYMNIKKTTSGSGSTATNTYSNIPLYTVVQARPYSTSTYATGEYNWEMTNNGSSAYNSSGVVGNIRVTNAANFAFAVNGDIKLSYVASTTRTATVIHTSPKPIVSNRQMMFYSQFVTSSSYTVVEAGTLYTKDSQLADMGLAADASAATIAAKLASQMQVTSKTDTTPKYSTVRKVIATERNSQNQYYLMVTENKGNAVTYYARGYVLVENSSGTRYLYHSPVIAFASVGAA